ncbi:MAG: alkaline phosphatase [Acidiferrobacteraceae bacterium]|nr:alkaline phosphatase [Acidiferrobacteraceae bacterium]|tara:strand:+ start:78 stop:392 length:315 start_codon:yes stop_codon:yes gene_type:complete
MNDNNTIELEAAAFRGLVEHLQRRTDVQNIDLMNLAGFCRNCLSKWYLSAAKERGVSVNYDQAREIVYGMAFDEWKEQYQIEATSEQKKTFEDTKPLHAAISGH